MQLQPKVFHTIRDIISNFRTKNIEVHCSILVYWLDHIILDVKDAYYNHITMTFIKQFVTHDRSDRF